MGPLRLLIDGVEVWRTEHVNPTSRGFIVEITAGTHTVEIVPLRRGRSHLGPLGSVEVVDEAFAPVIAQAQLQRTQGPPQVFEVAISRDNPFTEAWLVVEKDTAYPGALLSAVLLPSREPLIDARDLAGTRGAIIAPIALGDAERLEITLRGQAGAFDFRLLDRDFTPPTIWLSEPDMSGIATQEPAVPISGWGNEPWTQAYYEYRGEFTQLAIVDWQLSFTVALELLDCGRHPVAIWACDSWGNCSYSEATFYWVLPSCTEADAQCGTVHTTCGTRFCGECPANYSCQSNSCVCVSSPEVCDGEDNNCDGVIDNDLGPDSDGDEIPDACEAIFMYPGDSGPVACLNPGDPDTDGDGIPDGWEVYGYGCADAACTTRTAGPGLFFQDLPAWGANPCHKDVFVELDREIAEPIELGVACAVSADCDAQPSCVGGCSCRDGRCTLPDAHCNVAGDCAAQDLCGLGGCFCNRGNCAPLRECSVDADCDGVPQCTAGACSCVQGRCNLRCSSHADCDAAPECNYEPFSTEIGIVEQYVCECVFETQGVAWCHRAPARMSAGDAGQAAVYFDAPGTAGVLGNTDGRDGVALHIDLRTSSCPDFTVCGNFGGANLIMSPATLCTRDDDCNALPCGGPSEQPCDFACDGLDRRCYPRPIVSAQDNLHPVRAGVFHWFVLATGVDLGSSGRIIAEPTVLTHELGHRMGLSHGGITDLATCDARDLEPNCKPNYHSIMNYAFKYEGAARAFSRGDLAGVALAPFGMDESVPVAPEGAYLEDYPFFYRRLTAGCQDAATGCIDWNRDGVLTPSARVPHARLHAPPGYCRRPNSDGTHFEVSCSGWLPELCLAPGTLCVDGECGPESLPSCTDNADCYAQPGCEVPCTCISGVCTPNALRCRRVAARRFQGGMDLVRAGGEVFAFAISTGGYINFAQMPDPPSDSIPNPASPLPRFAGHSGLQLLPYPPHLGLPDVVSDNGATEPASVTAVAAGTEILLFWPVVGELAAYAIFQAPAMDLVSGADFLLSAWLPPTQQPYAREISAAAAGDDYVAVAFRDYGAPHADGGRDTSGPIAMVSLAKLADGSWSLALEGMAVRADTGVQVLSPASPAMVYRPDGVLEIVSVRTGLADDDPAGSAKSMRHWTADLASPNFWTPSAVERLEGSEPVDLTARTARMPRLEMFEYYDGAPTTALGHYGYLLGYSRFDELLSLGREASMAGSPMFMVTSGHFDMTGASSGLALVPGRPASAREMRTSQGAPVFVAADNRIFLGYVIDEKSYNPNMLGTELCSSAQRGDLLYNTGFDELGSSTRAFGGHGMDALVFNDYDDFGIMAACFTAGLGAAPGALEVCEGP